jgi:hypothetical protein
LARFILAICAATMLLGLASEQAAAQWASSCPPPLKLAAGACVASCPGGYEDRGRVCVFRSYSH